MEARLKKDKTAIDIHLGKEFVLLEAGSKVEISDTYGTMYRIAEGEKFEGLWLARHEIEVLLTADEVAERVDRHINTVLRWLGDGLLEGEKVAGPGTGGQWRVPERALESFTPPRPGPKPKGDETDE